MQNWYSVEILFINRSYKRICRKNVVKYSFFKTETIQKIGRNRLPELSNITVSGALEVIFSIQTRMADFVQWLVLGKLNLVFLLRQVLKPNVWFINESFSPRGLVDGFCTLESKSVLPKLR